jgi:hypothetical protein
VDEAADECLELGPHPAPNAISFAAPISSMASSTPAIQEIQPA